MKLSKFLFAFAILAALGVSCDKKSGDPSPEPGPGPVGDSLILVASTNAIKSDGVDFCDFTVTKGGVAVSTGVVIYSVDGEVKTPLTSPRFTSSTLGQYKFFASYDGKVTDQITIKVLADIAQLPVDPTPDNTAFTHRVVGLQMTGTKCPNCPFMVLGIRELAKTEDINKVILTGIHFYGGVSDPMFTPITSAISQAYGNGSAPIMTFNFRKKDVGAYQSPEATRSALATGINEEYNREVTRSGISASVIKTGDQIVITVGVKAAQAGTFRVGAWVLEDGIVAKQDSNIGGDFNTHENVVRDVAGRYASYDFSGDQLTGGLKAGELRKHVLSIPIDSKWVLENCKVVIFLSAPDVPNGKKYYINNAIDCEIGASAPFTYVK